MEVFIWGELPVLRSNEIIIPSSLVGVKEVGNDFVFSGPQLKVVNVAGVFFEATHSVAILDVG